MSMYKFLNESEKMVKNEFKSYLDALQYAKENNLLCLTMDYHTFIDAFQRKIEVFKNHSKYDWLKKQADEAIIHNTYCGIESIIANDFMKRIITLPRAHITEWLNGSNELEWLEEYR